MDTINISFEITENENSQLAKDLDKLMVSEFFSVPNSCQKKRKYKKS